MTALARLSLRAPATSADQFQALYHRSLAPLLATHGLAASAEHGRPTVPGTWSCLLTVDRPADIAAGREALAEDPAWAAALQTGRQRPQQVGQQRGGADPDTGLCWALEAYRAPAGAGRSAPVGAGMRLGLWQTFGVDDGLPLNGVEWICQDRHGHLWLTTNGEGVCRHDGATATMYTTADGLPDDRVRAVVEDRAGRIWCAAAEGPCCCDGQTWTTWTAADGVAAGEALALLVDRHGRLWCGTAQGLSCFDGQAWATFGAADGLAEGSVNALAEDSSGRIWCSTGNAVCRLDGRNWTTFTAADGIAQDHVWCIGADPQGRVWVGGSGEGVGCFDGQTWSTFTPPDGLPLDRVWAMAAAPDGCLWFGSYAHGVLRWDGAKSTRFTGDDGLANDLVSALLLDRSGDLWVGTWTGVSRYCQAQFASFTARTGLPAAGISSIGTDRRGGVWFGSEDGHVSRYDGTAFAGVGLPACGWPPAVWSILEDRSGRMWFGALHDLFCYDGQQVTRALPSGHEQGCRALLEDRSGRLWAGSGMYWEDRGAGLRRRDGAAWRTFTKADGLAGDLTVALAEDRDGRIWVGGARGGLTVCEGGRFMALAGLPPSAVTAVAEDRNGVLWLGLVGHGVWRLDRSEHAAADKASAFVPLTIAERPIHHRVTALLADPDGRVWIGTYGGGVYVYDGQVLQRLNRKDGLIHDGVQALLRDGRGDLWIGTEGGVTRYRPLRTAPKVRIVDVIADRRYGPVAELEVPVSRRLVAFACEGRSWTTRPEAMAYVHRLGSQDEAWHTTYTRWIEYHDLPLGNHTFQVRAVDRDLNYSEPATVVVRVVPDPHIEALSQAFSDASEHFVGRSPVLQQVQLHLAQVAPTDLTILILGETGTGKGLAARIVHQLSPQRSGPFLTVNCGGIPAGLLESEMFGHEKGAFTGAVARKLGKVELAQGGVLFLDEIGDLPPDGQAKLLRLLEEGTFERVGGTRTLRTRARVIAATNRDLRAMVQAGQFRQDLYFRLQGFTVCMPPLRERKADLPELALFFAGRMAAHVDKRIDAFEPAALTMLQGYHWPGNVRELESAVKRAVIVASGPVIRARDLTFDAGPAPATPPPTSLDLPPEEYERRYLLEALAQTDWVIKGPQGAAARLGLSPSTLHGRLKKLGISRP